MSHRLSAVGLLGLFLLAGCSFSRESGPPTVIVTVPLAPTNTLAPIYTFTPKFTATQVPTSTPIPSITPTPSNTVPPLPATATATLSPTASIIASVNFTSPTANLRSGPGQAFPIIMGIKAGTRIIVLGLNSDKDWYNVRLEDGSKEGWLASTLVTVPNPEAVAILSTLELTRRAEVTVAPTAAPAGTGEATLSAPRKPGSRLKGDVLAYCDNKTNGEPRKTLTSGTPVTIYWSWFAKTPEQLADHINSGEYTVQVDGQTLKDWRSFKTDVAVLANGDYFVYWYVPIGSPQPGDHTVDFKLTWKQQITDGYKKFGPGGDEESESGTCAFTIKSGQ
ncbi:MAG: SH3 domain-containing protein [Chloroflexota bacterium]